MGIGREGSRKKGMDTLTRRSVIKGSTVLDIPTVAECNGSPAGGTVERADGERATRWVRQTEKKWLCSDLTTNLRQDVSLVVQPLYCCGKWGHVLCRTTRTERSAASCSANHL